MYKIRQFLQLLKMGAYSYLPLVWTKRFKAKTLKVRGRKFQITDAASFIAMYLEIFLQEGYKFKSETDNPYVIDCGANIGLSLVYFHELYPDAKITAFEPDPELYEICKSNTSHLGDKLQLHPIALWNEEKTMYFESEGADGGRLNNPTKPKLDNEKIEVKAVRLKSYLDRKIDLLKIDIEGAEHTVLEDCKDDLQHVENLFVEYHSFAEDEQKLGGILQILEQAGFRYYIRSEGVWSKKPFIGRDVAAGMDIQLGIWAYRD